MERFIVAVFNTVCSSSCFFCEIFTFAQMGQGDLLMANSMLGCSIFEIFRSLCTWSGSVELRGCDCVIHHHLLSFMLLNLYVDNWLLICATTTEPPDIVDRLCLYHLLMVILRMLIGKLFERRRSGLLLYTVDLDVATIVWGTSTALVLLLISPLL